MSRPLLSKINTLAICICLILTPFMGAHAAAGCCSHHGGVKGCNNSTNHQLCKDGTSSPTCLCSGGKVKNTSTVKSKNVNTTSTNSTTVTTDTSTAAPTVTTTTTKATTVTPNTKGCCARHGGVARCDKASGYQMCKDGTTSATCKCS